MREAEHAAGEVYQIRGATPTDLPYIYSSWLNGLYYGCPFYRDIDKTSYFKNYERILTQLLSTSTVLIACLQDEPDVVLGYVVYRGPVLHWILVKPAWRKVGIAKALLPNGLNAVTHLTRVGKSLKPHDWVFDPFLI